LLVSSSSPRMRPLRAPEAKLELLRGGSVACAVCRTGRRNR
jgi:hypothetical protein